ncbi:MAG: hypothetical protein ABIA75_14590 [Candidatus Neomarinimicrobiota bacterium]
MTAEIICGRLVQDDAQAFVEDGQGRRHFTDELIWDGYLRHWSGQAVCARYLPQTDYDTGRPIIIMWPAEAPAAEPIVELYYNERLVKYPASTFGHVAINVAGEIFNFSHLINENEAMSPEEYFYRPALGEFAPSPGNGKFEILENGRAYYDKFGRNFMRTIHVTRVTGIDTVRLAAIFHNELAVIHNTPVNPRQPEKYRDFNFFTRSCGTIIRDGLRQYGFSGISGFLPRDLLVSATAALLRSQAQGLVRVRRYRMPQLRVPEAPPSALSPLFNPRNRWRLRNFPPEATSK